jgi:NAD(P)H-flavin reductase
VERRTMELTLLTIQPQHQLEYRPGQSVSMEIPQRPRLWRYFSPANAPRPDGSIDLHVQQIHGGQVSTAISRSLKVGDTVKLGAPVGDRLTRLDTSSQQDLLMVAGGTGLAPLLSVLEQIDIQWRRSGTSPRVHLLHGVRMPWHLYQRAQLRELAESRPWFEYTEVVSDDASYPGTRGMVGRVAARQALHGRTALVCGGPKMVVHTIEQLSGVGMDSADIHYEKFYYRAEDDRLAELAQTGQEKPNDEPPPSAGVAALPLPRVDPRQDFPASHAWHQRR